MVLLKNSESEARAEKSVIHAILPINLNMLIYKQNSIKLSTKEIKINPFMMVHELNRKNCYRGCNYLKCAFLFLFIIW